ncbi:MAG: immunity 22 family protein [Archangium sp.]|nr:immunity 22 family protein [Archangium sp.]
MRTETSHISLWLGWARTKRAFDHALKIRYSESGSSLGSAFGRAFGVRYDEDLREAMKQNKQAKSLNELLSGISYEAEAIPALVQAGAQLSPDDNCFICLYDFRTPTTSRTSWITPDLELRFSVVAKFRRPATDVGRWMSK